jgi:hypothetical protein
MTSTGAGSSREYRDYIDLAKLAQLIPVIGAPVGRWSTGRLTERLGGMAMNAYRSRWSAISNESATSASGASTSASKPSGA